MAHWTIGPRLAKGRLSIAGLVIIADSCAGHASDLNRMLENKFMLAEVLEVASYAALRCPGLHVMEEAIDATAMDAGVTDDDVSTPEWKLWEARGEMNAKFGYDKNPTGWCEDMWNWLGPDHPRDFKRAFLSKD